MTDHDDDDIKKLLADSFVDLRKEWWGGNGQLFMIWGILNPNGPTLYVLGSRKFQSKHRIFFRRLHFNGGETVFSDRILDKVMNQDIFDDASSIHNHLRNSDRMGLFDTIPSFIIVDSADETLVQISKDLLEQCSMESQDWGREFSYLSHFGSDFFGRAGAEIRKFYDEQYSEAKSSPEELKLIEMRYGHIPAFANAKLPTWTHSPQTKALLRDWWNKIEENEFQQAAVSALKEMWNGATKIQNEIGEWNMERNVDFDSAMQFVLNYHFQFPFLFLSIDEFEDLSRRAEAGEIEAQCELADRLLNGDGVGQDIAAAEKWLQMAAKAGEPWAKEVLVSFQSEPPILS